MILITGGNLSVQKSDRKRAVLCHYLCLVFVMIIFYSIKITGIKEIYLLLEIIPSLGVVLSFRKAFSISSLWKLTHTSYKDLDEREVQLVFKATSYSYSIFTILCLGIIYVFNLLGLAIIDLIIAACLLYVAHILPASIIAWNEK